MSETAARTAGRAPITLDKILGCGAIVRLGELPGAQELLHLAYGVLFDGLHVAGADVMEDRLVEAQIEAIQLPLPLIELTVDRPLPGEVSAVVADIGAEIQEDEVTVLHAALTGMVVGPPGIGARGDQRVVGLSLGAIAVVDEAGETVDLVFHQARLGGAHRLDDCLPGKLGRSADESDLTRALDEAQTVQCGAEVLDLQLWMSFPDEGHEPLST